jgi:hypothetical protein
LEAGKKGRQMKKYALVLSLMIGCLGLYGCAAVLVGAGVAGGIAISEDTAKLEVDTNFDRAWKITLNTVKSMGVVGSSDRDSGKIEATIQDSKVEAKIIPLTAKTVRIQVKARKNLLPNMDLAMRIINRINSKF